MLYRDRTINPKSTLLDTLKKMDILDKKLLIVIDNERFLGLISAGDIQRAIIQNKSLDTLAINVLRQDIKIASPEDSFESIKQLMLEFRMELCPVINDRYEILEVYFWEDIFGDRRFEPAKQFTLPVIIMAGGIGQRLKPLTNVLPKALIPIGEKTMLEEIFERFGNHGCKEFFISLNYKAELIEFYIRNQNLIYQIEFFKEKKPMGTAGSLSLLKGKINQTFFVSNCDILIEQDYSNILDYHLENKNEITVVAALKNYSIPYGTIETGDNGKLTGLTEKPDFTFKINSGMYILEPQLLNEIPKNTFFHITNLIENILRRKGKVGVYPVSERSWKDMGEWSEYYKNIVMK